MWPNTFNKKCATISGWQCLGDFAAVKQQLQKIRASTRISSKKSEDGTSATRPLPPLPGHGGGPQGNKSVRFALPDGAQGPNLSGSEGSDQGYESDQSRERRRQLELPGLLHRLAHLGQKNHPNENQYGHVGGQGGQSGQGGQGGQEAGRGGTLNRYHHDDSLYYGPIKSIQDSDRDLSTSSPVLLQLYDAVKVEPDAGNKEDNVQAAIARLASSENLASSYDLVLGLVRRPQQSQQSPRPCKRAPSTPPPSRHHCQCHNHHHPCNSSREREGRDTRERERDRERDSRRPQSRSRPSSPGPVSSSKSRSRPSSPAPQPTKSKWSFGRKAKRSASAERRPNQNVELGWGDMRPGVVGKWEDTGSRGWENTNWEGSSDSHSAATTAQLAGDLCRRATALRRTLYKMPGLINQRHAFLEIIKDVASEMKLLLDAAGRLAPLLPDQQRVELDMARRKLLETSRSFSNALKGYFKEPQATPVLLAATALVYRTDEIIQALEP